MAAGQRAIMMDKTAPPPAAPAFFLLSLSETLKIREASEQKTIIVNFR